jgi:hypothetical protein
MGNPDEARSVPQAAAPGIRTPLDTAIPVVIILMNIIREIVSGSEHRPLLLSLAGAVRVLLGQQRRRPAPARTFGPCGRGTLVPVPLAVLFCAGME